MFYPQTLVAATRQTFFAIVLGLFAATAHGQVLVISNFSAPFVPDLASDEFDDPLNFDVNAGGYVTFNGPNLGYAEFLFPSLDEDFTPYSGLSLRARTESSNSVASFSVFFYDSSLAVSYVPFLTSAFPNSNGFTAVTVPISALSGIDLSSISSWGISAGTVTPNGTLNISFDHLELVPEPATYALVLGAVVLGLAIWQRRRMATLAGG